MSRKNFSAKVILLLFFALLVNSAQAGNGVPALMPFQARVTDSGGHPITWPVNVLIRVYPPAGVCYLYEENFGLITPNPFGIFSVVLGAGTPSGPANTLTGIFNNDVASIGESCGGNYNPGPNDWRRLEIVVDGVPLGAMQTIGAASFAINSQLLSGHPMTDFIQTSTNITQANVEALTDGSDASALHNHDSVYAKLGSSNSFSGNLSTTGSIYTTAVGSEIGIGTSAPNADLEIKKDNPSIRLTGNGGAGGSPALDFFGGATQRGRIEAAEATNGLKLYSGSTLGMTLDASANALFGASVRIAGTTGLGQYTAGTEPALLTALAAGGASNIGAMWVNTTTNEVKYWNGASAITVQNKATALNTSTTFGGDVSGAYNAINVDKIDGKLVDMSTAPNSGEVLKWNGSAWIPSTVASSLGYTPVNKAGDTMTGLLVLSGDPSNAVGAATKQYVDAVTTASSGAYVRKDGTSVLSADWDLNGATVAGTIKITGLADPTASDGAATKGYVDTAAANATDNTKLPKAGGTMSGNIAMGGNSITGMADPSAAQDAATKNYADTKVRGKDLTAPVLANNGQSIRWNNGAGTWEYFTPNSGDALVANPLSQFAATTSAQLAGVISNETGSGALVFGTSPTLTTPTIGTGLTINGSTSGSVTLNAAATTTNGTYTWPSAIPAGNRLLQSDNAGNLSWVSASAGDALVANPLSQFASTTSAQLAGVISNETGTGVLVYNTSPTLGTGLSITGSTSGTLTINAAATTTTGTYTWPAAIPAGNRILQSDNAGNLTWVTAASGDALVANPLSQFASTTSAQLAGVISNETGSGALVFGTSPTLTTPAFGTGFSVNGSTSGTLTINAAATTTNGTYTWPAAIPAGNRILQSDNTGALSWVTASTGDALVANPLSQFASTTSAQLAGVISNETGSGSLVFGTSPTLTTPAVGTGITFNGATNGSFTLNAPAAGASGTYVWPTAIPASNKVLQSDSSGNLTWVTASTGDALVANPLSQFAATTSAQLRGVLSDETGTGAAVFATSPTLGTGLSITGSTSGTLTINAAATTTNGTYTWPAAIPAGNRVLQSDNAGNLTWVTDQNSGGDALVANPLSQFASTTSAQLAGVISNETGSGSLVFGTSPTLTTPTIGTGLSITGSTSGTLTINAAATTTNGTYTWPAAIPAGNRILQSDNTGALSWVTASTGDALVANPLSQFASTTSAQLAGVLSNETGSGLAVFDTSPTLTTPSVKGFTLAGATNGGASFTIAAAGATGAYTWPSAAPGSNKFLQSDSSGNLSWQSAGAGDALTSNPLSQFASTTSAQLAGVVSNETGSGALVFGTSPTLTTPAFGTGFSVNGSTSGTLTINAAATTTNGTYTWPAAIPAGNRILQTDNTGALSWVTAATGDALVANPLSQFASTTSAQLAGVISNETGTGVLVYNTSPTLGTGLSITGSTSGTLTINAAATTTNGTYTWPAAIPAGNRVLQSDNAGNLTWVTDQNSGGDALVANPLSQFASTTSAQLAGVISNETGSGALVFGTSPTLTTPTVGTGITFNGATNGSFTLNAPATGAAGTYVWPAAVPASNKFLQSDSSGNLTWATAGGDAVTTGTLAQFASTTSAQLAGVLSNETGSGAAVFGTSPTITTPTIGTGLSITGSTSGTLTINAAATTTNGTYTWPAAIPAGNRVLQSDNTGALSWVTAATGDALVANPLSQFAATTSAQLRGVLSDETGTGAAVFATSPTLGTGLSITGSTSGTLTINAAATTTTGTYTWPAAIPAGNRVLQSDNTGALSWVTAATGDALVANPLSQFASTTSAQLAGVISNETGSGSLVFGTSPTLTTPAFGTGFSVNGSTSGTLTINAAATTTNGTYTWPAAIPAGNRVLQSDNAGNLSWVTDANSGGDALVANPLSQFASTTSAQLAGVISNETGSGSLVFGTSPTLTTPTVGTGITFNGATNGSFTINAPATGAAGTYVWPAAVPATSKVLQSDSSGNLSWVAIGGGGDALVANPLSQFAATTSAQLAGVISNETGSGSLVFGTSPTLTTPTIGTGLSITGSTSGTLTINAAATTTNGTYTWPAAIPAGNRVLQSDNAGNLTWVTDANSGGDALVANPLSQFASTTSAQLAGVISNETGTGVLVYNTSPTLGTGLSITGSTSGTLTINAAATTTTGTYTWPAAIPAGNRVLQSDNTGALSWVTAATGDALVANPLSQFAATTSAQLAGVISNETGSGALVFGTSPTLTTPTVGTGITFNGATNGSFTLNAPATGAAGTYVWPAAVPASNKFLQSDSSGNLTWATAGGDAVTTGTLAQFASTTSAQLAGVISNETGSGSLVFGTSPTLTTPAFGTGFSVNGSTSGTLTINAAATTTNGTYTWPAAIPAGNRVLQSDNAGNLSWVTAATGDALVANPLSQFASTTSAQLAGVLSNETGTGLAVFDTSPTLTTPSVKGFTLAGATNGGASFTIAAAGATGTYTWPSAAPGSNKILQSDSSGNLSWVSDANSGGDALVANPLSQFASTTSAQLAGVLSNETGSGAAVFGTSPTITTPTIGTGLSITGSTSGTVTINAAATTTNGTYTWPAAVPAGNRLLQSDSSGNLTWIAAGGGGDAFVSNPLSQFASTTSAQLAGVISNETGTGVLVYNTSPTLGTGLSITGSTSGTLTINAAATTTTGTYTWPAAIPAGNRVLQSDNTGALSWVTAATGDALVANPLSQFASTTSAQLAGVISNETGSGSLVFGTSPTLTTPAFGTGFSVNGSTSGTLTINAAATTTNGTYTWPAAIPAGNRILQTDNTGALSWVTAATGDALVANPLSQFASTTSAQLRGVLSDETGTGAAVFATSPTLGTGVSITGSTSGTLTINAAATTTTGTYTWPAAIPAGNRVLQTDNTGALSWVTAATGDALVANPLSQFASTTSAQLAGVISNETGSGALVFGTSPTITTPAFGTGFSVNGSTSGTLTINAAATTTNGTYTWPAAIPAGNRVLQSDNAGNLTWVTDANSGGDALVANPLSQFASTTSAQLAGVISNETGTGVLVYNTSPTLGTGLSIAGSTSGTLTINAAATTTTGTYTWPAAIPAGNRILQTDNTGALSWVTAATGDALVANPLSQFASTTSAQLAGVISNETGTGVLVYNTSPTLGTGLSITGSTSGTLTINAAATTTTGTYTWPAAIPAGNRVLQSDNAGNLSWVTDAGGDALVANPLSQFASTTSAQLRGVLSDETGTGAAVFATSPTLGTGVSITGSTSGTLTINAAATTTNGTYTWPAAIPAGNRILQTDNTGALSWVTAATGDALVANPLSQFASTTSAQLAGVLSNETGTGAAVFGTSPTITTPTIGTGLSITGSTSGTLTINAAATTTNGTYTWPAAIPAGNRVLQSDNAGNLTWVTDQNSGGDALVANPLSQFASTTSAQLAGVISNETGSGALVFGTSPTITTPAFGTGFSVNGSTSGTLTINAAATTTNGTYTWPAAIPAGNRILQTDNTGALSWVTAATGDALVANPLSQFASTTSAQLAGVISNETGTGVLVYNTSPTLGTGLSITGSTSGTLTINAAATTTTGTYTWPAAIPAGNRVLQSDNAGNLSWVTDAGGDALVANPLSQFASTTSAQLAGVISNETGSGALVFGTSPTLTTPTIGTGLSITGSTSGTLTINAAATTTNGTYTWPAAIPAGNRVLQSDSSGNLTWVTDAGGDALVANPLSQFASTTSAQLAGVISNETGSGVLVYNTSPTLATGFSVSSAGGGSFTITAPAAGVAGSYIWPSALPGANMLLQSDSSGNLSWVAAAGTGDFKADGTVTMTGNIRLGGKYLSNDGGNEGVWVDTSGNVGIQTATITAGVAMEVNGTVRATNLLLTSDRRAKKDIHTFDSAEALAKILMVRPVNFVWRNDDSQDSGVIAQELQDIFPYMVHDAGDGSTLSVKYTSLISPLIGSVQELNKKNEALAKENAELKERLSNIERETASVKDELKEIKELIKAQKGK